MHWVFAFIALSLFTPLFAQNIQHFSAPIFEQNDRAAAIRRIFPEVERIYREHASSNHFPGLAYGIVLDGELIAHGSYGVADLATGRPVTKETLFRIASMTKSFTALAILQLRDKRKIELDAPASRYLKSMRHLRKPTSDSPEVTVRHLLTHSAGFPEDNPWGDWQLADTDKELQSFVRNGVWFSNPPGLEYEYSNLGYALLGQIVQSVSRQSCQDYITQRILTPLQMNSAHWDFTRANSARFALGYRWEENQWKPEPILGDGSYGPMGGLICSLEEFAHYAALHLQAWPARDGEDSSVLSRASLREMHQPWRIDRVSGTNCPTATAYGYGLGWSRDCNGIISVGHSGGLPGYGSNWRLLPEYGLAVIALANRTYASARAVNSLVVDHLIRAAGLKPRQLRPSQVLQERKEEVIRFLPEWTSAEDSDTFAENFFRDTNISLRRKLARELFLKAGDIRQIGPLQPLNQLRGRFILEGTQANIEVFFTLTPENPPRIQALEHRLLPRP